MASKPPAAVAGLSITILHAGGWSSAVVDPPAASKPPAAIVGLPTSVECAGGQVPAAVKPPVVTATPEADAVGLEQLPEQLLVSCKGAVTAQLSVAVVHARGQLPT